jgi:integrase
MKGTIRERTNKDGTTSWLCQVEISRDPATNKRRFKSGVAATKREASTLVHTILAEADKAREERADPTALTSGRLIEEWLRLSGPPAQSTRSVYAGYIKNQIKPHLWDARLDRLKVSDLDNWYLTLREAGLKPASVRKAHTIVRAALAQGVRWGWTPVNVAAMAKPPVVPKPVILTPQIPIL